MQLGRYGVARGNPFRIHGVQDIETKVIRAEACAKAATEIPSTCGIQCRI